MLTTKDKLTEEEIEIGLKSVIKDGLTSQTMVTLTGGVFLVAFALKLGASNTIIGLLAAIPFLMQLLQIPTIYLIEKFRQRKLITVFGSGISRIFWLLIAITPLIFSGQIRLIVVISAIIFISIFGAIAGASWNPWMRDLIPQQRLGAFFSKRMTLATTLSIPLSLVAAFFIDYWKKQMPDYEIYSYSILFFLGFLAGMLGVYFVSTIPEPTMPLVERKEKLLKIILQPFKDTNFKNLIIFLSAWNFAVNLAAPFFTVYMLVRLQLSMAFVIALTVLSQLSSLLFFRIWGKFSDRLSNKSVLSVSGPLFMFCIFAWTFTTLPEKHFLTIPLLGIIHIFMGISIAGVTLATGNIGLKLAPKGTASSYLAANSLVNSLAAGIAPILGGKLADFFSECELSLTLKWLSPGTEFIIPSLNFRQWDFFFFIAFLIGTYSIHRLALVKEEGEVEEEIVIRHLIAEVRRPLRNFSTAGGLIHMIQFPIIMFKHLFKE